MISDTKPDFRTADGPRHSTMMDTPKPWVNLGDLHYHNCHQLPVVQQLNDDRKNRLQLRNFADRRSSRPSSTYSNTDRLQYTPRAQSERILDRSRLPGVHKPRVNFANLPSDVDQSFMTYEDDDDLSTTTSGSYTIDHDDISLDLRSPIPRTAAGLRSCLVWWRCSGLWRHGLRCQVQLVVKKAGTSPHAIDVTFKVGIHWHMYISFFKYSQKINIYCHLPPLIKVSPELFSVYISMFIIIIIIYLFQNLCDLRFRKKSRGEMVPGRELACNTLNLLLRTSRREVVKINDYRGKKLKVETTSMTKLSYRIVLKYK